MPVRGAASEQPTSSDLVETAAPVPSSEEQGPTEVVERPSSEVEPSKEAAAVSLPPEDTATEVSQPGGEPMGQQAPPRAFGDVPVNLEEFIDFLRRKPPHVDYGLGPNVWQNHQDLAAPESEPVSQPGGEPMGQQAPQGDHQDLAGFRS